MSHSDVWVSPTLKGYKYAQKRRRNCEPPPTRTAPVEEEPGFYEPLGLWLYGNSRLLEADRAYVPDALGDPSRKCGSELDSIEYQAEQLVLAGKALVCGIHNAAHQRAALVPLRWGGPRIVVFSGGFLYHLGINLDQEPFRAARLWRYQFDAKTDLAVSRRAPEKLPTFANFNPTVDRLIQSVFRFEGKHEDAERPFMVRETWPPTIANYR